MFYFDTPDVDRNYRGNTVGLAVSDIVTSSDNVELNQCCRRVSPIHENEEDERQCIRVEG